MTLLSHSDVQGIHLLGQVFQMDISELPTPVPPDIYTYVAVAGDGDPGEAVQSTAFADPDTSPATETGNEFTVCDAESDVKSANANQSAEQHVAVDKWSPRTRYDAEERAYEQWLKRLL